MSYLYLLDGSALFYRAYFAFIRRPLINSKGKNTSAIFGFTQTLLKILKEKKPEYFGIVFDTGKPTFRHKYFADYKAQRPKMPEEMRHQLPPIKEIISALSLKLLEVEGFEADDVIATLAKKAEKQNIKTVIISGDKDFLQLVNENIHLLKPKIAGGEETLYDPQKVETEMGVKPYTIPEVLALCGDSIDNVPGVPGIGEKTALKLIKEYKNLESLWENLNEVPKFKEKLLALREQVLLARELLKLHTDVPLSFDLDELKVFHFDKTKLIGIFKELEFNRLLNELTDEGVKQEEPVYQKIDTTEKDDSSNSR
ncbi:MAG: 5'-3' exonuclease H3TH domain-containing protein [Candidatus Edwardsbacteria bacterium]